MNLKGFNQFFKPGDLPIEVKAHEYEFNAYNQPQFLKKLKAAPTNAFPWDTNSAHASPQISPMLKQLMM